MVEPVVSNTLRVQRAIRNLTQADLAERAGITRASVNAIEGGRMVPSILLALKLARALGASVDDLFGLPGEDQADRESASPRTTRS
jgi:putative transcriptional regulator